MFVFCCIMFFSSEKNTPEITTKTNYSTVCNSIKTTYESGFSEYKISLTIASSSKGASINNSS